MVVVWRLHHVEPIVADKNRFYYYYKKKIPRRIICVEKLLNV